MCRNVFNLKQNHPPLRDPEAMSVTWMAAKALNHVNHVELKYFNLDLATSFCVHGNERYMTRKNNNSRIQTFSKNTAACIMLVY